MDVIRASLLITSLVLVGMMAGVFFAYAVSVMPGLAKTDDRTFVAAFQSIDRAIVNPWFLLVLLGAVPVTGAAALAHLAEDHRRVLPWAIAAFVLYLAAVVITMRVHVPLNDGLKAAGDPDSIDLAAVRERFNEAVWARWNIVRTVLNVAALACLSWAALVATRIGQ